jgi:hypothetical protein
VSAQDRTLSLTTKIIVGATPPPSTSTWLRASHGLASDVEPLLQVFEVHIDNTVRYCCWSGGVIVEDPAGIGDPVPSLTMIGQAACEAMMRLPHLYGPNGECLVAMMFQGLHIGKKSLREKVMEAFRKSADDDAVICFVGDLKEELNGHMPQAFNLIGVTEIGDLAPMTIHAGRR